MQRLVQTGGNVIYEGVMFLTRGPFTAGVPLLQVNGGICGVNGCLFDIGESDRRFHA